MNAITTTRSGALALPEDQAIEVLRNSLYPGAKPESVRLVLSWCRATGRDPMKKPIHIVPMWVRDAVTGKGELRDVLMPGIGTYRTDAANSGQYAGKGEPEFGPEVTRKIDNDQVTFPQWCKVTVQRLVAGQVREFTAKEYWLENYATGKEKKGVNDMWRKRPFAQLAKCAESQALRMAFPDETGNTNTAEEMEGKGFEGMTLEGKPEPSRRPAAISPRAELDETLDGDRIPTLEPEPERPLPTLLDAGIALPNQPQDNAAVYASKLKRQFRDCQIIEDYNDMIQSPKVREGLQRLLDKRPELWAEVDAARQETLDRLVDQGAGGEP